MSLIRPEQGTGDRTRNREVEAAPLELCESCVPLLWANVGTVIAANLLGRDVVQVTPEREKAIPHGGPT